MHTGTHPLMLLGEGGTVHHYTQPAMLLGEGGTVHHYTQPADAVRWGVVQHTSSSARLRSQVEVGQDPGQVLLSPPWCYLLMHVHNSVR